MMYHDLKILTAGAKVEESKTAEIEKEMNSMISGLKQNIKLEKQINDEINKSFLHCKEHCDNSGLILAEVFTNLNEKDLEKQKVIEKDIKDNKDKIYGRNVKDVIKQVLGNYERYGGDNKVYYHDKSHALITAYVAIKLWHEYNIPSKGTDTLTNVFLAALAHDIHHDGSVNGALKCIDSKSSKIKESTLTNLDTSSKHEKDTKKKNDIDLKIKALKATSESKTCNWDLDATGEMKVMEKIQADKAIEVYDIIFSNNIDYKASKDIIKGSIDHTWMLYQLQGKSFPKKELSNVYNIVHAADLISQVLHPDISNVLGQMITHELDVTNPLKGMGHVFKGVEKKEDRAKNYAKSQQGFMGFFKIISYWLEFIKVYDEKRTNPMSYYLISNLKSNYDLYNKLLSDPSKFNYIPI